MALYLAGSVACFIRHFEVVHGGQLFDRFHELELVVVHQEVDSIAVRPAAEAVVKLFFTVDGERGGFFVMERTARVKIFALLFQLYPGIDQIDDVGARQQVIDKYSWDSSSHMPRFIHLNLQIASALAKFVHPCHLLE